MMDLHEEERSTLMHQIRQIDEMITKLDRRWVESEKVLGFYDAITQSRQGIRTGLQSEHVWKILYCCIPGELAERYHVSALHSSSPGLMLPLQNRFLQSFPIRIIPRYWLGILVSHKG